MKCHNQNMAFLLDISFLKAANAGKYGINLIIYSVFWHISKA